MQLSYQQTAAPEVLWPEPMEVVVNFGSFAKVTPLT